MRIAVLGAGLMGKEAARDLLRNDKVEKVILADRDTTEAQRFKVQTDSERLEVVRMDASMDVELESVMKKADVVINALFYTFNEKVAQAAVRTGVHAVDLGGHIGGATEAVLALHEKAEASGITIIPDLGVAPGMINILAGHGARKLDEVKEIRLFVGGIPVEPEPPLEYNHVFSLEGLFDHYTDPSHVIRDGKVLAVPSLSEIEHLHFGRFGELEAFHTSGGTSTLMGTFKDVETLEYKTVRYKGHAEKFRLLIDLGFTDRNKTVEVGGYLVRPRDVLREVLKPVTALGNKQDAVVLRVIVSGVKSGEERIIQYDMATVRDMQTGITAMARATAFTVSVVAQLLGGTLIQERGVYPPELIVPGDVYMEEMAKRGVQIEESTHRKALQNG